MARYILLPAGGLTLDGALSFEMQARSHSVLSAIAPAAIGALNWVAPLRGLSGGAVRRGLQDSAASSIRIVESAVAGAAKLVEMSDEGAAVLNSLPTPLRAHPVVEYRACKFPSSKPRTLPSTAAEQPKVSVRIITEDGRPIAGAEVVATTNAQASEGDSGLTNDDGVVELALGVSPVELESLYVSAPPGYWGHCSRNISIVAGQTIEITAIVLGQADSIRRSYAPFDVGAGARVRIAVIDSGIGPHADIRVGRGANVVARERQGDWADNGLGHGTHVAGIIAGQASWPMGLAPAADIWSGRVFAWGERRTTNFEIMSAIILAVHEGCDLINLSLETDTYDGVVEQAIRAATQRGVLVIAAAGNGGQPEVAFPARSEGVAAISALGELTTYPAGGAPHGELGTPQSGDIFFACSSNWGREISFIAPGVGVISTSLSGGYEVRSGTSMACAAVTGLAARLLSRAPDILDAPRDEKRSAAIHNLLQDHATPIGFGRRYEGAGRV